MQYFNSIVLVRCCWHTILVVGDLMMWMPFLMLMRCFLRQHMVFVAGWVGGSLTSSLWCMKTDRLYYNYVNTNVKCYIWDVKIFLTNDTKLRNHNKVSFPVKYHACAT